MRLRTGIAALGFAFIACIQQSFGTFVTYPDPPPEPPVPPRYEAQAPPELVPTSTPGLLAAPALDPTLYYWEPEELWYRWAFNRWYVAFRWEGNWFPTDETPGELAPFEPSEKPE